MPPPPSPPPSPNWAASAPLCLALTSLSFGDWQAGQAAFQAALQGWAASALSLPPASLQVQSAAASFGVTNGTTLALRLLSPTGGAAAASAATSLLAAALGAGAQALAAALAAAGAQGAAAAACALPPPPLASIPGPMAPPPGSAGQAVALAVPYGSWRAAAHAGAVQSAVGGVLGLPAHYITVQGVSPGWRGGTVLLLALAAQAQAPLSSLFSGSATGSAAGAALEAGLRASGLPCPASATCSFWGDQP